MVVKLLPVNHSLRELIKASGHFWTVVRVAGNTMMLESVKDKQTVTVPPEFTESIPLTDESHAETGDSPAG